MRVADLALLLALFPVACSGQDPSDDIDLVVYCSLDQDLSEGIFRTFTERTGLQVETQFDVERNKTVGLVNRILAEASNPRADVYWNNEIAHTLRLKEAGLTRAYESPSARDIPASFRDADGHWTGFAARARVILYRTDKPVAFPRSLEDFLTPEIASRGAMAQPLTGTTLTNATWWSVVRGEQATLDWFAAAEKAGLSFGSGNADVMRRTCSGDFDWCFTDTDDAAKAIDQGHPVAIHYLDQGLVDGGGAMLIPNTLCALDSGKNQDAAQQFIDFVLSVEVEEQLAASLSQQIPLHPTAAMPEGLPLPGRDYAMSAVDWVAVAEALAAQADAFQEAFVR